MSEIIKTKLVGVALDNYEEHSRQEVIKRLVKTDENLFLEREPNNKFDNNAISVYVSPDEDPWDEGDYQIGYLSKDLATRLAPVIDSGGRVTCVVLDVTGGSNGENFGVNVALGVFSPEEVAEHEQTKLYNDLSKPTIKIPSTQKGGNSLKKGDYKIGGGRAIGGIILNLFSLIVFPLAKEDPTILILAFFFMALGIFLLFPWFRWIFDQIKKMFARKQLRGGKDG